MPTKKVIVVGAGIGGLVTAIQLASRGLEVSVLERAGAPGGKMREVQVGDQRIDAGPTVFTMRWIFEEIFAEAGASLTDYLTLKPFEIIARHAWSEHERLDLLRRRGAHGRVHRRLRRRSRGKALPRLLRACAHHLRDPGRTLHPLLATQPCWA